MVVAFGESSWESEWLVIVSCFDVLSCVKVIGKYRKRKKGKKEGQLFRGRYKAELVDGDSHLLEVLRYIHRNPVRAGIVKTLNDYPWSSYHGYLSKAKNGNGYIKTIFWLCFR